MFGLVIDRRPSVDERYKSYAMLLKGFPLLTNILKMHSPFRIFLLSMVSVMDWLLNACNVLTLFVSSNLK